MTERLRGLELSRRYYFEVVRPILDREYPDLSYAAGLIGPGSEVQGWDDDESTDHHWGLRLQVLVDEKKENLLGEVDQTLRSQLPHRFLGHTTNFSDPDEFGVRLPIEKDTGPVKHMIECKTVSAYLKERIGLATLDGLADEQWLGFLPQRLRELARGEVFHDGPGTLTAIRKRLAWYPRHIWFELMARVWDELDEEEAFVGRAGNVGDDRGSRLLAARQIHRLMRLTLLMEREFPPYGKWLGTAFAALPVAETLGPQLDAVLQSDTWRVRQTKLAEAYETVARRHNELGFTDALGPKSRPFYSRPYTVIGAARFAQALRSSV